MIEKMCKMSQIGKKKKERRETIPYVLNYKNSKVKIK